VERKYEQTSRRGYGGEKIRAGVEFLYQCNKNYTCYALDASSGDFEAGSLVKECRSYDLAIISCTSVK
jgi:hypothetical protein